MNKRHKVDFMIYNIKKDEWTWISEIKSGEWLRLPKHSVKAGKRKNKDGNYVSS